MTVKVLSSCPTNALALDQRVREDGVSCRIPLLRFYHDVFVFHVSPEMPASQNHSCQVGGKVTDRSDTHAANDCLQYQLEACVNSR
jgi:hypothetical protein